MSDDGCAMLLAWICTKDRLSSRMPLVLIRYVLKGGRELETQGTNRDKAEARLF